MNHEEEEETCLLDYSHTKYTLQNPPKLTVPLNTVISDTVSAIRFQSKSSDKTALRIYTENAEFFHDLLGPVFWLVHVKLYFPQDHHVIQHLQDKIGHMWGHFTFPLEIDSHIDSTVRERFYESIPYFFTQAVQQTYILFSCGNPKTVEKDFRMRICEECIIIFTGISPTESHRKTQLANFFAKPPPADIDDRYFQRERRAKDQAIANQVLLPVEDLSTLVETEPRRRAKLEKWNIAGVSPVVASATGHRSVPYDHDAMINMTFPQVSGMSPLLPDEFLRKEIPRSDLIPEEEEKQKQERPTHSLFQFNVKFGDPAEMARQLVEDEVDVEQAQIHEMELEEEKRRKEREDKAAEQRRRNYHPMKEPRSLLHRSLRPDLLQQEMMLRVKFERNSMKRKEKQNEKVKELQQLRQKLMKSEALVVDTFLDDLRGLQLEKKRDETPQIKTIDQISAQRQAEILAKQQQKQDEPSGAVSSMSKPGTAAKSSRDRSISSSQSNTSETFSKVSRKK